MKLSTAVVLAVCAHHTLALDITPYAIGLWGDVPYTADPSPRPSDNPAMVALTKSMNSYDLAFTVFTGDTKSGSSKCDDEKLEIAKELFKMQKAPTVYAIGDNEWTDCHRTAAGGYDPLPILQQIRRELYSVPEKSTLAQRSITVYPQRKFQGTDFVENVRWQRGPVMYVVLHMVGSNNNKINADQCIVETSARTYDDCAAANAEYETRNAANIAFMIESFTVAKKQGLKGIMIIAQADPNFDAVTTGANEAERTVDNDGFTQFIDTLYLQTKGYYGQVVYVHGDTHEFTIDKPLPKTSNTFRSGDKAAYFVDGGKTLPNFTRLMTFGADNEDWVMCTVDASHPSIFIFEQMVIELDEDKK